MAEVEELLDQNNPEEMAKEDKKSKNYNKRINCNRCGKKIRDDRLNNHQNSKNCKTSHAIYSVD